MLFTQHTLAAIAEGRVDLAFRRWRKPTVKTGGRLLTAIGELAIDSVKIVAAEAITDTEARRAGFPDRTSLLRELDRRPEGEIYRVAVRFAGADPRIALRQTLPDDLTALTAKLADMDRRHGAPWTAATLTLIAERPAVRAGDLAAVLGEPELAAFKARVRRLKALGLTESLEIGYRLSPRGEAALGALAPATPSP